LKVGDGGHDRDHETETQNRHEGLKQKEFLDLVGEGFFIVPNFHAFPNRDIGDADFGEIKK
jgi:hypothetical protein